MSSASVPQFWLIIPAAGAGKRMQGEFPKQYLKLGSSTVLDVTLSRFLHLQNLAGIALVVSEGDNYWQESGFINSQIEAGKIRMVMGGKERFESVHNAILTLAEAAGPNDWVMVHDAVRPFISHTDISNLIATLENDPVGGLLAIPVRETVKESTDGINVTSTLDRNKLWLAATPQMFRYEVLARALGQVLDSGQQVTDEAAAVEALGLQVKLVPGLADNIKLTYPEDLPMATSMLKQQSH